MGILDDYAFNKYVSHILRKLFFNFSTKYEVIKKPTAHCFFSVIASNFRVPYLSMSTKHFMLFGRH